MEAKEYKFVVEGFKGSTKETEKKEKTIKIVFSVFSYVFLTIFALIMMFPFYWMVLTSLKQEVFDGRFLGLTNEFFISFSNIMRKNYTDVVDPSKFDFLNYLLNTVIVLVISTIGTLFITIFASFAFARLEFKGKDLTFYVYLMTMMIPSELFVITNYISVYRYGLLEDRWGVYFAIMLPFFVNVFYIYLLNENFKQIPNELYLASKIDGKSDIKYLFKVMIPIASPTLITIVILKVISTWNAYAWPKIVTGTSGMRSEWTLISVGIRDIANFVYREGDKTFVLQSLQMAATVLVTIPLVIIFIVFRKYIMSGTSRAGIKGWF